MYSMGSLKGELRSNPAEANIREIVVKNLTELTQDIQAETQEGFVSGNK